MFMPSEWELESYQQSLLPYNFYCLLLWVNLLYNRQVLENKYFIWTFPAFSFILVLCANTQKQQQR